jgi:quercetin dioxygenase-like cupin family protein
MMPGRLKQTKRWERREEKAMFSKQSSEGYRSTIKGIKQKTLVYGQSMLMSELRLSKGTRIPTHEHPHEQTGYLVTGKTRLFIDDDVYDCNPGDSWCIPGNAKHGTFAIKDSVVIEIFSPVREDLHPDTEYSPFIQSWNR